jgi:sensor histidine kinase regulating citrate/malate metabolism
MDSTPKQSRMLWLRTELLDDKAIVVSIEDTGPGIDPQRMDSIFGVGHTTKGKRIWFGVGYFPHDR